MVVIRCQERTSRLDRAYSRQIAIALQLDIDWAVMLLDGRERLKVRIEMKGVKELVKANHWAPARHCVIAPKDLFCDFIIIS